MAADRSFTVPVLAIVTLLGAVCFSPATAVPGKSKAEIEELKDCLTGVNPDCGVIVAAWLMFGEMLPPSEQCCTRLIDMGKECHELLVGRLLENKSFKGTSDDVIRRSNKLWEFCAFEKDFLRHHFEAPAPAPAFSN